MIRHTFTWRHLGHLGAIMLLGVGFGAGVLQLFSSDGITIFAPSRISAQSTFSIPSSGRALRIDLETKTVLAYEEARLMATYPILSLPPAGSPWEVRSGAYAVAAKEALHHSPIARSDFKHAVSLGDNIMLHERTAAGSGGIGLSQADAEAVYLFVTSGTPVFITAEGPFERVTLRLPAIDLRTIFGPLVARDNDIRARAYLVGDLDTGEVLASRGANSTFPIASVSKLFTALVASDMLRNPAGAPPASKRYGVRYEELLYPLLLISDNAAADELARLVGREKFIGAMNEKARELALESTSFRDPSGLSPGNKSSAADLFVLARHIFSEKKNILDITRAKSYKKWVNLNRLVRSNDETYLGGKVGFTPEAGQTWVAFFSYPVSEFEHKNIAVVLLGSANRYGDAQVITSTLAKGVYKASPIRESAFASIAARASSTPLRLVFAGDVMLDRGVEKVVKNHGKGDYSFMFEYAYFLKEADVAFANIEGPVSDKGYDLQNLYSFRMEPEALTALRLAGVDVLSVSNNHMGDWGRAAFEDTLVRAAGAGILAAGGGKDLADASMVRIVERDGVKIGYLAFSDVGPAWLAEPKNLPVMLLANNPDFSKIITDAKKKVDLLVTSLHFGEEYHKEPSARQQALAHAAVDAGADIVVGHHPHVRQPIERYKDSIIAYSLGNFIFDQAFSPETLEGGVLEITLENKKVRSAMLHTVKQNEYFQPILDEEFEF